MKNMKLVTLSIMSLFFVAMGVGTITPAIANIAAAFPDVPFTTVLLVSTLPSLLVIPSTLITGMVAGKSVKFKTLALIGTALFAISGMAPAIFNSSFALVIVARAFFGISLGILSPLGNALIMGYYEGQSRANMLGVGSLVMNIGGIVLQFLGGTLSGISWELCFLAHAFSIISFILVLFFLKDPEIPQAAQDVSGVVKKDKIPGAIWVISICFGLITMLIYPMLVNMSSIMTGVKQIGDAASISLCLSMYTVGGAISGALFGKAYAALKRYIIPIGLFGSAAGLAVVVWGNSVAALTIGTFITGLFQLMLMPAVMMLIGIYAPPSVNAMGISIMMAVMNAFAFASTYWIKLVGSLSGDVFLMPLICSVVAFIGLGIIFLFVNPFPKKAAA